MYKLFIVNDSSPYAHIGGCLIALWTHRQVPGALSPRCPGTCLLPPCLGALITMVGTRVPRLVGIPCLTGLWLMYSLR